MKWLTHLILDLFYPRRTNTLYLSFHYKWDEMHFTNYKVENSLEAPEENFIIQELKNLDLKYWNKFIKESKKSRNWGSSKYAIDYEVTWDNKILINERKFREIKN